MLLFRTITILLLLGLSCNAQLFEKKAYPGFSKRFVLQNEIDLKNNNQLIGSISELRIMDFNKDIFILLDPRASKVYLFSTKTKNIKAVEITKKMPGYNFVPKHI